MDVIAPVRGDGRARRTGRTVPGAKVLADGRTIVAWIEVLAVMVVVAVYVAMPHDDPHAHVGAARDHASTVVAVERFLHLGVERSLQHGVLSVPLVVVLANAFYGSLHFVATAFVFVWLFRRFPDAYPDWRNTFAVTSLLALLVTRFWPVMPPRLLPATMRGHLVDTLGSHPSLWSFAGPVGGITNQMAAMPSVHCAWALMVALVVVPRASTRRMRALAAAYPLATAWVVVVTGNHYVLDVVGGAVVVGLGWCTARLSSAACRTLQMC